ncbi:MAG: hypothetical protein CBC80_001690 [Flavobacteriaceae bacterium TMED120]|nr:MAG: hypothetical protein CBC80_001690 [Flavobacteriaceae bacterium TMED120]
MIKCFKIEIITTGILLLIGLLLPIKYQNLLGGLLILSLGILHGANDIQIITKKNIHNNKGITTLYYLGIVLIGGLAFFFFPTLALLCFVLFSAYHFGEQHWEFRLKKSYLSLLFYFVYGACIFSVLFFFHRAEVQQVVEAITSYRLPSDWFYWALTGSTTLFIILLIGLSENRKYFLFECLLLLAFALFFSYTSLILAFGFYFVVWHSFPSLKSQFEFLYRSTNKVQQILSYIEESIIYWVAAIMGLAGVYLWIDFSADYFLPLFFTFLAAITFPHVLVMHWMFRDKK